MEEERKELEFEMKLFVLAVVFGLATFFLFLLIIIPQVYGAVGGLNQVFVSFQYLYDVSVPNLSFTTNTDANGTILNRNWTMINVSMTEYWNDTIVIFFNGSNHSSQISNHNLTLINTSRNVAFFYLNKTNLTNGRYDFYAWTNDSGHNINQTETRTVSVYTTQPNISVSLPLNNSQEVDSPSGSTTIIIYTNEQSVCEYGSSTFSFGDGTRFTNTNSTTLNHNSSVSTPQGSQKNLYYICQNLGGISSSRVFHTFYVRGSTQGGGSSGAGGGGYSGVSETQSLEFAVIDLGTTFTNKTITPCNIQLSSKKVTLSKYQKEIEVAIGNFHNSSITPDFFIGLANNSEMGANYVVIRQSFSVIPSGETGKFDIIALNTNKSVSLPLEIRFKECPSQIIDVVISSNPSGNIFEQLKNNKNILLIGMVITMIILVGLMFLGVQD